MKTNVLEILDSQKTAAALPNEETRRQVLRELERMLAHPTFRKSARCSLLFRHLVERALDEPDAHLKERALGYEVFGREPAYDTATDPVVRTTVNDIRKRIGLYIHEAGQNSSIRIELPQGSYLPKFTAVEREELIPHQPSHHELEAQEPGTDVYLPVALAGAVESPQPPVPAPAVRPFSQHPLRWIAAALVLATIVTAGLFLWPTKLTNSDRFWKAFPGPSKSLVICLPDFQYQTSSAAAQPGASRMNPTVPVISWPEAITLFVLRSHFQTKNIDTFFREGSQFTLSDLKNGPVIFVGGLDNHWVLDHLSHLRFHIVYDSDAATAAIVDSEKPDAEHLIYDEKTPYRAPQTDYAVISRFQDPTTGNPVLQLSGLGPHGSASAAEFVMNPKYMNTLDPKLFSCGNNLQFVIATDVVDGSAGAPTLVASNCW